MSFTSHDVSPVGELEHFWLHLSQTSRRAGWGVISGFVLYRVQKFSLRDPIPATHGSPLPALPFSKAMGCQQQKCPSGTTGTPGSKPTGPQHALHENPRKASVNQGNVLLQPLRPLLVPAAVWELKEGSQPAPALRWGIKALEEMLVVPEIYCVPLVCRQLR